MKDCRIATREFVKSLLKKFIFRTEYFYIDYEDQIIRVFNTPNTSKNYEKQPYQYSSGMHGSGGKTVNALSSVFVVESYKYDGTAARVEFEKGYPKYDKYKPIPNKEKKQG